MAQKGARLGWGILAAGKIAHKFARGILHSATGRIAAVASRDAGRAEAFAGEFGIARHYDNYQALLEDREVRVVYVATPHPFHAEWAIRAAESGKHVLCEKPIGMNRREAEAIVEAARANGVFLMEAFMYRCQPQTARLVELVCSGILGEVRAIRASFSYLGKYDLEGLKLNKRLGGGGILDVGCYPVSLSRLLAGAASGKAFAEPLEVRGQARLNPQTGVDEYATALLSFPGGILAELAAGVQLARDNTATVYGTAGRLEIPSPWFGGGIEGGVSRLVVRSNEGEVVQEIEIVTREWLYALEADTVAASLDRGEAPPPAMGCADTLGNMETLDRWRGCVGLEYESDQRRGRT